VGGASVNQPSDKNIPDVYQILLQNHLLMQNQLHNQSVSVPNTNSKRSATASCTVSKETEVRQKRQKTDDRHAHRHHVKPALADNYSKELNKLFWTDSECGNDYSDISSEWSELFLDIPECSSTLSTILAARERQFAPRSQGTTVSLMFLDRLQ
jgi:hypothetical protein